MSIRLNRKKLLCISFFLCCVLPACFGWFAYEGTSWRGLSLLELPLLVSTTLFGFALMFERPRYLLYGRYAGEHLHRFPRLFLQRKTVRDQQSSCPGR